jgi:hypothetical protein
MGSLKNWLRREDCGYSSLRGIGNDTWGDLHKREERSLRQQFWCLLWALIWPKPPPGDDLGLVVTSPQDEVDGLTRWVAAHLIPFYAECCRRRIERRKKKLEKADIEKNSGPKVKPVEQWGNKTTTKETIRVWSEKGALRLTAGISMVVACLLPVAAITVLTNMHSTRDLLLCLAGFTVLFAAGLMFLTGGAISRVEIFMATAA